MFSRNPFLGFSFLALAVAMIVAWQGRGGIDHFLGLFAVATVGIPIVLLCLLHGMSMSKRARSGGRPPQISVRSTFAWLLSSMLLGGVISYPIGACLRRNDVADAVVFSDRVIPGLEAYRAQHQRYPARISEVLADDEALPRLFTSGLAHYDMRYLAYEIAIRDERSLSRGKRYSSPRKAWEEWTNED